MNNEINKIDQFYYTLSRNINQRGEYTNILANMDRVKEENVYIYFKMIVHYKDTGWNEVKHSENDYEIPHELNERIYHLVHNYYFKKIKELEEERDKITDIWLKQYNEQSGLKICSNCKK